MSERKKTLSEVRVIVIDDNDTTRAMLRSILRSEGVQVVAEARDGATGVEMVRKFRPEIVCLDVLMPDIGGLEVLARIRAEFPDVRVVMVTGATDRETVEGAIGGGALAYLVKPFNVAKVLAALEMAMARK